MTVPSLSYTIIINDLIEFNKVFKKAGYKGILLILDEAQILIDAIEIKQHLRNIIQHYPSLGIVFAGESSLANLFTNVSEPFYGQSTVIRIENFVKADDVAECALLPLNSSELKLVSPMTIGYITKLSR